MKTLKFTINFLLCFILMMLLVFTELSFVTSSTLINSDYYARSLNKVGYYDQLKVEIEKDFISLGQATGLPKEVFENSIDKSWLETEGNNYISSLIDYFTSKNDHVSYELHNKPLENKLQGNINDYAKEIGFSITKDGQTSITTLIERSMSIVKNRVMLVDIKNLPVLSARKFISVVYNSRLYLIIADMLVLMLIFMGNKKQTKAFFHWSAYSLIASGLFVLLPSLLILISSMLQRLALSNVLLKEAISTVLSGYFSYVLCTGLVSFIIGIMLLAVTQVANPKH